MPRPRTEARRRHWMTRQPRDEQQVLPTATKRCARATSSAEEAAFSTRTGASPPPGRDCSPDDIGVRRQVLICESDAHAEELQAEAWDADKADRDDLRARVRPRATHDRRRADRVEPQASGVMDAAAVSEVGQQNARAIHPSPEGRRARLDSASEFIFGSPATVTEPKIVEPLRFIGAGNIMHTTPNR